ncbi:MAG TPA: sel1 repeat family protein [Rhodocyclaceae bacterium]|nr:sel1 repeat family protein [Rhodocyclaceae bacterium]
MKRHFCCLLASVALMACATQQDKQTVRLCTDSGCYDAPKSTATFVPDPVSTPAQDKRMDALTALAERDPRAAYDLGLRLYRGDGVPRNTYQALTWMRSAAERGYVDAQLALGRFYLVGLEEMGSDPAEAESWLGLAAAKGNAEAKRLLVQASAAKKNEAAQRRLEESNKRQWQAMWASGYQYRTYWYGSSWVFY